MNKISLCVPTYNRPDSLRQLIHSFLRQDYEEKELVISDDSPNSSIKDLVEECNNSRIKYFHNNPGLGFSRNLLRSMERATGKYLVLLGDDDVLFSSSALSEYVSTFEKNPSVGFIYSSMIQYNDEMDIDYVISFASKNKFYKQGKESMENIWLRSIFIGGIGVRNSKLLTELYPTKKILHPQVEFIGNIINLSDSCLLATYNIGFRSHDDQIIFRALRNKKIRQEGNHMTVEVYDIFHTLKKKYKLDMDFDMVVDEVINQQTVMLFKEKNNLGYSEMKKNYENFCKLSRKAKNSTKLKIAFLLASIFPSFLITALRSVMLQLVAVRNKEEYKRLNKQLVKMISSK